MFSPSKKLPHGAIAAPKPTVNEPPIDEIKESQQNFKKWKLRRQNLHHPDGPFIHSAPVFSSLMDRLEKETAAQSENTAAKPNTPDSTQSANSSS